MPPERNAPSGTSAIMRRRTASARAASRASAASSSVPVNGSARPGGDGVFEAPEGARRGLDAAAAAPDGEHVAGANLLDALIDRARRRHVAHPQVVGEGVAVDLGAEGRVGGEGAQFRAEEEDAALRAAVERLDAEAVAREVERARLAVPERECEHPDEAFEAGLEPPRLEGSEHDLGVRVPAKAVAARFERAREVGEVVDLAVVDHHEAPARRRHRLVAVGREVEDREAAVAEGDAALGVGPRARVVGAAVGDACRSGGREGSRRPARRACPRREIQRDRT